MASVSADSSAGSHGQAWNEAYDRLESFLKTFELDDHAFVSRLALELITEAKQKHVVYPPLTPPL